MPVQMVIGLVVWILGLVLVFVAEALQLGSGAVLAATSISSVGSGLFAKERFAQSPSAARIYSKRPPGFDATGCVFVLVALLLVGCAGSPVEIQNPADVRARANVYREQLNELAVKVAQAGGYIPGVCAFRGDDSIDCKGLRAMYSGLQQLERATRAAIDVYDVAGVGVADVSNQVDQVIGKAESFAAAAAAVAEVVHAEIRRMAPRSGGSSGEQPPEGAAGAGGESQRPPDPGPAQVTPLSYPVS